MEKDGQQQGCQQCGKSGQGLAGVPGEDPAQSRRSLLSWLLGGGVAASLASFFYPVIHFLNPPHISEAPVDEVSGGKVGDLEPNSGKIVRFGSKPALAGAGQRDRVEGVFGRVHASELHGAVSRLDASRSGVPATTELTT